MTPAPVVACMLPCAKSRRGTRWDAITHVGFARDTGSLVWVAVRTASSDFEPYTGTAPLVRGAIASAFAEQDTAFMSHMRRSHAMVIELVDLARNAVVVSARTDGDVFNLLNDRFAFDHVEDDEGFVRLRVWSFDVRGR